LIDKHHITCFNQSVFCMVIRVEVIISLHITLYSYVFAVAVLKSTENLCIRQIMWWRLWNVSAVVVVNAELYSGDANYEDNIVSRSLAVLPAGSRDHIRRKVDELDQLVSQFGLQTRLVLLERANSIVLFFVCLTLSAVESLRDQWRSRQLSRTVASLFTLLCKIDNSTQNRPIHVKRLTWRLADYQRCVAFFRCPKGKLADNWLSLDMHYARLFTLLFNF